MSKPTFIYALVDPREPQHYRYIGYTISPKGRLKAHIYPNKNQFSYKANWIKKLLSENVLPVMKIIAAHTGNNFKKHEIELISRYKESGHKLTNTTLGGDGPIVDDVYRDKARERLSKRQADMQTDEVKQKRSKKLDDWRKSREGLEYYDFPPRYKKKKNSASKYFGVSKFRKDRWKARYNLPQKRVHIGIFFNEDEAAAAVLKFCKDNSLPYRATHEE